MRLLAFLALGTLITIDMQGSLIVRAQDECLNTQGYMTAFSLAGLDYEAGMGGSVTIDGVAIPSLVGDIDDWSTGTGAFNLMMNARLRAERTPTGGVSIRFVNSTGAWVGGWQPVAGATPATYLWPMAGNVNGVAWAANTKGDTYQYWTSYFPGAAVGAAPMEVSPLRFWGNCLIAQASCADGILPVWSNIVEGYAPNTIGPPYFTLRTGQGVNVERWFPTVARPGAADPETTRYPRFDRARVYPGQFIVCEDMPPVGSGPEDAPIAGVFGDLPLVQPFYSTTAPDRIYDNEADQGTVVANDDQVSFMLPLRTVVRVVYAGGTTTSHFGYRIAWGFLHTQQVQSMSPLTLTWDPATLPVSAAVMGQMPAQVDLDYWDGCLLNGNWFMNLVNNRQRIAP